MDTGKTHSLLRQLRLLIGLGLTISVVALGVKSYYLDSIERRALDLMQRTAPVIEVAQHVPERIIGLRQISQQISAANQKGELTALQARLDALAAAGGGFGALRGDGLLAALTAKLDIQRDIAQRRVTLAGMFRPETRRLDTLAWRLEAEQSRLSIMLKNVSLAPETVSGVPELVAELTAVSKIYSAVGALRVASHEERLRLPSASIGFKHIVLREIAVIATHLARMQPSTVRDAIAREFGAYKVAMLGQGGVFEQFGALRQLLDRQVEISQQADVLLDTLVSQAERATRETVADFMATAQENRATTRAMRKTDLLVTAIGWIGLSAYLWLLIERNLFARIEHLVSHVRAIADGGLDHPIRMRSPDEIGELERAAEQSRVTTRAKLDTLIENAPSGIVTVASDGTIQSVNLAMMRMFDHDREELAGMDIDALLPTIRTGEDALLLHDGAKTEEDGERSRHGEMTAVRKDGSRFETDVSVSRIEAGGETSFVAIIRDVSDRKAAEAKLRDAYAKVRRHEQDLERSNHDLDNFAYAASHDLKAPLRGIQNISGWIKDDLDGKIDEETDRNFALMDSRIQRMLRLLDDLLAYSRIGRAPEQSEEMSGAELVTEVVGLCEVPPGFRVEVGGCLADLSVETMPLKNIVLNLVSNAIKHHDRDVGVIRVQAEREDDGVVFEVSDDGPGIAPEYHERVLRLFETLRPRDEVEGSGMGLAMVKRHVDLRGGKLEIRSGDGRGTAFRFSWPQSPSSEDVRLAG